MSDRHLAVDGEHFAVAEPWRDDRPIRWRLALIATGLAAVAYIASRVLSGFPGFVESAYAGFISPLLSRPISLATGLLPFSVVEVLIGAWIVRTAILVVRAIRAAMRGTRHLRNAFARGTLRLLAHAGFVVVAFYILWGFNYARAPLERRMGWPDWSGADARQIVRLAEEATIAANEAYLGVHGVEDAGTPTTVDDMARLEDAIGAGYGRAARLLPHEPALGLRYGTVKWPLVSPILARLGITGIYSPFTAEANVRKGLPAAFLPQTMAHEKAHQRGVTNEAEASFIGFVAAAVAPHPLARYSAALFAQAQLAGALRSIAPDDRRRILGSRLPGVERDIRDLADYFQQYAGLGNAIGSAVNDRYLRANRVPGGIRSYGRSVRLLVAWADAHGEVLMPRIDDGPVDRRP